jgi:hypothetical protein
MSKKSKREERIRKNRSNVSLEDFEALINQYGHIKEGSKHPQAIIGNRIMTYKRENPVKPVYITGILKVIDNIKGVH